MSAHAKLVALLAGAAALAAGLAFAVTALETPEAFRSGDPGGGLIVAALVLAGLVTILIAGARPCAELDTPAGGAPVTLTGHLEHESRWLWMFKWLLAIPHYVIIALLSVTFAVLTTAAFFAILFTGRYPAAIFATNLAFLRWNWRVGFYAFSGLGTDRYPPFTLVDVDYPARLTIAYPERLSRGLVLVKWWLLAIPHYIIVAVIAGGGIGAQSHDGAAPAWGLLPILVLFAGIALLFRGRYPTGIFDLVVGINRWTVRLAAYVALMRDEYPPFRLDQGEFEPALTPEASA